MGKDQGGLFMLQEVNQVNHKTTYWFLYLWKEICDIKHALITVGTNSNSFIFLVTIRLPFPPCSVLPKLRMLNFE